jgi:hypothetical protein
LLDCTPRSATSDFTKSDNFLQFSMDFERRL